MSANSKIEWTDHTFNPWIGCTKVSPACDHCYAEVSTPSRALGVAWGAGQERRRTSRANWALPLRWNAQAAAFHAQHGRRQRVFCASLADVFDNEVNHEWRADLLALIRDTPNLDWLLLTKRIGNVLGMVNRADDELRSKFRKVPDRGFDWPLSNVWLGATITSQAEADRDIPKLLRTPARVRFLSMEPLLGPVDLTDIPISGHGHHEYEPIVTGNVLVHKSTLDLGAPRPAIDWVIVGGESGPQARPLHPDWARGLRDQCQTAGVPFLFKQWGEWSVHAVSGSPVAWVRRDGTTHTWSNIGDFSPDGTDAMVWRVGKKAAGRLLDGVQLDGYPVTLKGTP